MSLREWETSSRAGLAVTGLMLIAAGIAAPIWAFVDPGDWFSFRPGRAVLAVLIAPLAFGAGIHRLRRALRRIDP